LGHELFLQIGRHPFAIYILSFRVLPKDHHYDHNAEQPDAGISDKVFRKKDMVLNKFSSVHNNQKQKRLVLKGELLIRL